MPDDCRPATLLSHIAHRHTIGREDVATDALAFILTRSAPARQAFANFLHHGANPDAPTPAIAKIQTQHYLPGGNAFPDLACLDGNGKVLAFAESKFWAGLTDNQPVAYWNALPAHSPTTLLFIAPPYRVNQSSLWDDLAQRLQNAGHPLGAVAKVDNLIHAPAQNDQRRLLLCSWGLLLDHLAQAASGDGDQRAVFEIAELQGLAHSVITGADAGREDNLKTLIRNAIDRLEQSGWAIKVNLASAAGFYGWYLHLAGASAWLGIRYHEWRTRNQPLWLAFLEGRSNQPPATYQARHLLADLESAVLQGCPEPSPYRLTCRPAPTSVRRWTRQSLSSKPSPAKSTPAAPPTAKTPPPLW